MPGGNHADAHRRQMEGSDTARPDGGHEAIRRAEKVHRHGIAEGADRAAARYGRQGAAHPQGVRRGAPARGVHADRDRIQSEADTRLHGRVGHGLSAQKRVSAMRSMLPDKDVRVRKIRIPTPHGSIPALILSPRTAPADATGVLWIHGGGYIAGMKEMVHMSRAVDPVKKFGAVVLSPGYRLAPLSPYPAALDDCYAALIYLKENAAALGVRSDQLMVGGESAGVPAELDVYHSDMHAFDMMRPDDVLSIQAAEAFNTRFADAQARFFAPQHEIQEERHDS